MRKIYIVGGYGADYANWCEGTVVRNMEDADIVLFTGGEDVWPALYGKTAHPTTSFNKDRDAREVLAFKKALSLDKYMLGICRGAQFLCVMAGGTLVQDQSHPYLHDVITNDGQVVRVTSTHHQRQHIEGIEKDTELIAWCEGLSPYSYGERNQDILTGKEVEIAYYKNIKALAIQSHPEHAYPSAQEWEKHYIGYCRSLLDKYFV